MSTATTSAKAARHLTQSLQRILPRERSTLAHLEDIVPQNIVKEGLVLRKHVREGRFQRSLAVITAISGFFTGLEVGYEHYRGSYGQRIMYTPIILSVALMLAGAWAVFNRWAARTVLRLISLLSIVDGVLGFYYHIRGVARKPGGWRIPIFNVIMGPPVFAPLLFSTVGFLGLVTSFLRREDAPTVAGPVLPGGGKKQPNNLLSKVLTHESLLFAQDVREGRFQRILGVVAALSALFSWIESLYSHYKNNFSYRIQWSPILVGPPLVIAGIASVWSRTVARTLLPLTSLLALLNGAIGFFYHLRGVVRRPGGLKKPFYNVLYGPPIFAPLLFSASGFIGLLASLLRRARR